jgi:hypothetical protein
MPLKHTKRADTRFNKEKRNEKKGTQVRQEVVWR